MPLLLRGDATLHFEVYGEGYPLLALAPGGMLSCIARWRGKPSRPDAPVLIKDPTEWLAPHYRVIAMDQRNAGASRALLTEADGWQSYADDQSALLDHLGVQRCHLLGACIGVSFALRLCPPPLPSGGTPNLHVGFINTPRPAH